MENQSLTKTNLESNKISNTRNQRCLVSFFFYDLIVERLLEVEDDFDAIFIQ